MSISNSSKLEMQAIIKECLDKEHFDALNQCLSVYEQTFGKDSFYYEHSRPLVSLICLNVSNEVINDFLAKQDYKNVEIVKVEAEDTYQDICDYFSSTHSSYICFLEPRQKFETVAISQMVSYLEKTPVDMVISARNFVNDSDTLTAHPDLIYQDSLKNKIFSGRTLLEFCLKENVNLFGILSTIMVSTEYAQKIHWKLPDCKYAEIMKFAILSQFMVHGTSGYIDTPLVSTQTYLYQDESHIQECFCRYIEEMNCNGLISVPTKIFQPKSNPTYHSIDKHITFFCTDKCEYYNVEPIAIEAQNRGYEVTFSDNIRQKAEIGVYCQHFCFPENSKFSLILLHDLTQSSSRWPNIWEIERWNNFDIGILPSEEWGKYWTESACHYYVNPRLGTYLLGYPKADITTAPEIPERAEYFRKHFKFKYNFTVLYAPSWENDEKEDDFVRALLTLPVNLLIKQAPWPGTYPHILENIRKMRILHENQFENVYYMEPTESILTALELCDLVVSDESNVMTEAILFKKPSIAVTDWLIPDTEPSRFAYVDMDYVLKCKRVELREHVEKLSSQPEFYAEAQKKLISTFSNQGQCCKNIVDVIDYYTQGNSECDFKDKQLISKYSLCRLWN